MGSSIKINSISIDLAGAAKEIDMVKCDHFSIRGFVAETRERDHNKCWPFPEESVILVDQESYSLPSLSVPKFRWWRCMSCIRDINADDGTKDCELPPNSRSISGKKLDRNSLAILSQSKLNSLTINDQKKERRTDIAGNAFEGNEDIINCNRSQKDDHRATTVRRRVKKLASQEQVRNKRAKVTDKHNVGGQAVTTFGSSEIAGVVEDTPPKAIKNHSKDSHVLMECDNGSSESINVAMTGLQRRKTRKVRRLSELLDQPDTKTITGGIRKEESSSSKRGRKRKVLLPENNYVSRKLITVGATSENNNASKSCESDQEDYSTSTDSEFDRDLLIKGKQKNRRFQVVDEYVPSAPSETLQDSVRKNDADLSKSALSVPCPLSGQRTEKKLSLSRKKKNKHVSDNGKSTLISFSSGPSINASSQYTRDLLNDRLASEGYFRKPFLHDQPSGRPVNNNDHVIRSRDVEPNSFGEFGSSSKPNPSGWLRTGVDFSSSSNNNADRLSFQNFNLRNTSSTTQAVDPSSVMQKEADRKGKTVMFQEHHHEPSKSHDRKENAHEDQNDDIPMEIVELLAKNQYERCLPDKEDDKQPSSQETTHKPKNTLLIDLNETYDMEDNNNNTSRPPKPCDNNARREEQQHKPLDFFPIRMPSPFGIFPPPPPQDKRFSGHTSQWLGNVPNMSTHQPPYRVLRACTTCQSVPHPLWTTSMRPPQRQCHHHHTPVSFNMDPSTKLGMLSQPPSNENAWNLNFVAANGKQKCGSTSSELSFGCKHGGGVNNSNRSVDASFSSESSIPALHLLSLMDPRVGPNTKATTKRHFPHVSHPPKERIEIQTGDSSKTTKQQLPYDYYSKGFPIGTSSFSFQNTQQPSWIHHHHQENKTKRKDIYTSSNNDQGRFQLLGASDSMKLPLKFHMMDKEKKQNRKPEKCSNNTSTWLQKNSCEPIVCSVNRNPADFTVAELGNVYMLTGDSLKIRKRATYKKKTSLSKEEAVKQTKKLVLPVTENA